MKMWKFLISLIAASITSVSQLSIAAMAQGATQTSEQQQKKELSEILKNPAFQGKGTFNDLYKTHRGMLDAESQSLMESWLSNFGSEKLPITQAQVIKDKNGQSVLQLSLSKFGQNAVIQFNINEPNSVIMNGQKLSIGDLRHSVSMINKLAVSNSLYKDMAKKIAGFKYVPPQQPGMLSTKEFLHLSKLQKVQYMSLIRQNLEAAQVVFNHARQKTAQMDSTGPSYVLNAFFASIIAQAADVTEGDKCLVAGSISIYKNSSCTPFPTQDDLKQYQPSLAEAQNQMQTFNQQCQSQPGAPNVACNPLVYGMDASSGQPYCQKSTNQPDFTDRATEHCNVMSPLLGDEGSPERKASYERILKSYYTAKDGKASDMKDCFNSQSEINQKCVALFQPQYESFKRFKADADVVCPKLTRADQKTACDALAERSLELYTFIDKCRGGGDKVDIVTLPDVILAGPPAEENCQKAPGSWNKESCLCTCQDGTMATKSSDDQPNYTCGAAIIDVSKTPPAKKDRCKNDDGSKNDKFSCGAGPWIIGGGILALLLLSGGHHHKKPKAPPVYVPPTTTPPSEGGTGTPPGSNGGVRPTPTPAGGTH